MNKKLPLFLALAVALSFAGCSRQANVTQGKWLDYGDGLLNLSHVYTITSGTGARIFGRGSIQLHPTDEGYIKFDEFTLGLEKGANPEQAMESIRAFLRSNDSYLKLSLKK